MPTDTIQLCRMWYADDKSRTQGVSCKSSLQLACDCPARHEECRGLLKHVLKPYDNRSDRQLDIVEIVYEFSMTRAARAIKIASDNSKPKLHPINRPLGFAFIRISLKPYNKLVASVTLFYSLAITNAEKKYVLMKPPWIFRTLTSHQSSRFVTLVSQQKPLNQGVVILWHYLPISIGFPVLPLVRCSMNSRKSCQEEQVLV